MKREGEQNNSKSAKKAREDQREESESPVEPNQQEESRRVASSLPRSRRGMPTTPSNFRMNTASSKLSSPALFIPAVTMPVLQAPARPVSRVSREEFRKRLIWTIDEALRIIEEDSDIEGHQ